MPKYGCSYNSFNVELIFITFIMVMLCIFRKFIIHILIIVKCKESPTSLIKLYKVMCYLDYEKEKIHKYISSLEKNTKILNINRSTYQNQKMYDFVSNKKYT